MHFAVTYLHEKDFVATRQIHGFVFSFILSISVLPSTPHSSTQPTTTITTTVPHHHYSHYYHHHHQPQPPPPHHYHHLRAQQKYSLQSAILDNSKVSLSSTAAAYHGPAGSGGVYPGTGLHRPQFYSQQLQNRHAPVVQCLSAPPPSSAYSNIGGTSNSNSGGAAATTTRRLAPTPQATSSPLSQQSSRQATSHSAKQKQNLKSPTELTGGCRTTHVGAVEPQRPTGNFSPKSSKQEVVKRPQQPLPKQCIKGQQSPATTVAASQLAPKLSRSSAKLECGMLPSPSSKRNIGESSINSKGVIHYPHLRMSEFTAQKLTSAKDHILEITKQETLQKNIAKKELPAQSHDGSGQSKHAFNAKSDYKQHPSVNNRPAIKQFKSTVQSNRPTEPVKKTQPIAVPKSFTTDDIEDDAKNNSPSKYLLGRSYDAFSDRHFSDGWRKSHLLTSEENNACRNTGHMLDVINRKDNPLNVRGASRCTGTSSTNADKVTKIQEGHRITHSKRDEISEQFDHSADKYPIPVERMLAKSKTPEKDSNIDANYKILDGMSAKYCNHDLTSNGQRQNCRRCMLRASCDDLDHLGKLSANERRAVQKSPIVIDGHYSPEQQRRQSHMGDDNSSYHRNGRVTDSKNSPVKHKRRSLGTVFPSTSTDLNITPRNNTEELQVASNNEYGSEATRVGIVRAISASVEDLINDRDSMGGVKLMAILDSMKEEPKNNRTEAKTSVVTPLTKVASITLQDSCSGESMGQCTERRLSTDGCQILNDAQGASLPSEMNIGNISIKDHNNSGSNSSHLLPPLSTANSGIRPISPEKTFSTPRECSTRGSSSPSPQTPDLISAHGPTNLLSITTGSDTRTITRNTQEGELHQQLLINVTGGATNAHSGGSDSMAAAMGENVTSDSTRGENVLRDNGISADHGGGMSNVDDGGLVQSTNSSTTTTKSVSTTSGTDAKSSTKQHLQRPTHRRHKRRAGINDLV